MKLFGRDLDRDIVVIAEIGVNHEGSPETARRLLQLAAGAGADVVKFQSYTPERYVSSVQDPERFARITRFALTPETHEALAAEAKQLGVHFLSTPVSEDWVPLLSKLGSAIKIASGDLTFEPVIRAAARTGKPVIMSVGLGTPEEIDQAVAWVREEVGSDLLANRLVLLHCVVAYPTPIEEANTLNVPFLAQRYGLTVGFSNHVIGPEACYAAVALGARVVEVHFTDQKEGRTFRDHALSMEAADLGDLIAKLRRIRASLGTSGKTRQACEVPNLAAARKGVVAGRDLSAGERIDAGDIMFARPIVGFSSSERTLVIGRRVARPLRRGQPVRQDDLAD